MLRVIGIDLGTSKTVMAALRQGEAEVLPNGAQGPFTPSLLAIGPGGELLAGHAAAGLPSAVPVLCSSLGRTETLPFNGLRYTPTELAALFLAHLKAEAEAALAEPVERVVLSVPVAFGAAQAMALRRAAQLAGLLALRLVHGTTVAALAYSLTHPGAQTLAVCDVGAGHADAAIVRLFPGALTVLGAAGAADVGGEAITESMVAYLLRCLEKQSGLSWHDDPQARASLRPLAERAKASLAYVDYIKLTGPLRTLGLAGPGSYALTREELEELSRPYLEEALSLVGQALAQSGVAADALEGLLLIGGAAQMPFLHALAKERFPGVALPGDCNPLLAVAQGAAALGGLIAELSCPTCGLNNPVQASACRRCGSALALEPRRICSRCFLPNDPRRHLCWKCGARLKPRGARLRRSQPIALSTQTCPHCGARLASGRRVCPACHAPLAIRRPAGLACRRCGQVQDAGVQTCSRCGELVAPFVGEVAGTALSLEGEEGRLEVLFPQGAPVPSARPVAREWRTAKTGTGEIRLYVGEAGRERPCARLLLTLPAGLAPGTAIALAFSLDADGLLQVEAAPAGVEARLEWEVYDG